jgi:hypothetical protein
MVKKEGGDVPIFITGNEARGGLHEHRVHYVLAFGLAGGIIAFVAVGLYFGYGKLTQTISQTSIPSDPTTLVSYAILIALAAYNSEIAALRSEGVTRTLSIAGVEQLFTLGFALEQMHHNLAAACRSGRGLRGRTDVACPARSAPFFAQQVKLGGLVDFAAGRG